MPVIPVQLFMPGTETAQISSYGNSLLATLWVKSIEAGASVLVRWYDIGPGSGDFPGEKIYIAQHAIISTDDTSDRRLVPGIHNKCWVEIIVSGGQAELGVYATSVSSFPQQSPFKDEDIANLSNDAGSPIVLLDRDLNKYFLATGKEGATNVNIVGGSIAAEIAGDPFVFSNKSITNGMIQTLISQTVPANKLWKLRKVDICSRCYGEFYLKANSVIIGEGKTSPVQSNVSFTLAPYMKLDENLTVEVDFKMNYGPQLDVSAYLHLTEEPN
jgi:hypothetical protein